METTIDTSGKSRDYAKLKEIVEAVKRLPDAQKMQAFGYIQGISLTVNLKDVSQPKQ